MKVPSVQPDAASAVILPTAMDIWPLCVSVLVDV